MIKKLKGKTIKAIHYSDEDHIYIKTNDGYFEIIPGRCQTLDVVEIPKTAYEYARDNFFI